MNIDYKTRRVVLGPREALISVNDSVAPHIDVFYKGRGKLSGVVGVIVDLNLFIRDTNDES